MGYLRRPIREGFSLFAGFLASVEGFRYEDLSADLIEVEVFLLNMRYNVALAIENQKTD